MANASQTIFILFSKASKAYLNDDAKPNFWRPALEHIPFEIYSN